MLIYVEGPPLVGKSHAIRTLLNETDSKYNVYSPDSLQFPADCEEHLEHMRYAVHKAVLDFGRHNPGRWLVSRTPLSSSMHQDNLIDEHQSLVDLWQEEASREECGVLLLSPDDLATLDWRREYDGSGREDRARLTRHRHMELVERYRTRFVSDCILPLVEVTSPCSVGDLNKAIRILGGKIAIRREQ